MIGILVMLVFTGCNEQNSDIPKSDLPNKTAANVLPEYLVGIWHAKINDEQEWGFKLESDGSISKMDHAWAGRINVTEGGVYDEGPGEGTFALFVMGPCEADYGPQTRQLDVKIIIDHYLMKLPNGELEGKQEDYFRGKVSEDGKTWNVEWVSYSWLKGAVDPDIEAIDAAPEKLVFTKLDMAKLKERASQPHD